MFKEHNKITVGFVIQKYVTLPNGTLVCVDQELKAGDSYYEDMEGNTLIVGDDIDVDKEVYCPMDLKRPKQLPDDEIAVKFLCSCGHTRLEAVMDGPHTTIIEGMVDSGDVEYGDTESEGYLDRFQCVGCGKTIEDKFNEPIKDDEELVEWCKENCNQE